jgi:FixJ family two-component response regulator
MPRGSLVCIVDDDDSVRESLRSLFASTGITTLTFSSAELFLASNRLGDVACLVLDVCMPGITGPELQRELLARQARIPVVFITATTDAGPREQALRDGALEYLTKPFDEDGLLDIVRAAIAASAQNETIGP